MKHLSFPILGPFGWPKHENGLPSLLDIPGVYLMTVKHQEGFLPYGVGVTRRPAKKRFMEHSRFYVKGEYNILDLNAAQNGSRKVLWKGWGWTTEKRADYETRKNEIITFAKHQMSGTRIFIIDMGITHRLLERMEATIANLFYKQDDILFDRGMLCMPRWESEEPVIVTIQSTFKLYGIPTEIEI